MATQHVIRTGTWVQEFAPVIEFLARFGIGPATSPTIRRSLSLRLSELVAGMCNSRMNWTRQAGASRSSSGELLPSLNPLSLATLNG